MKTLIIIAIAVMLFSIYYVSFGMKQGEEMPYVIRFRNTQVPDIAQNEHLKDKLTIKKQIDQGYLVLSRINDKALKTILKEDYHLTNQDVLVQSSRVL